MSPRLERRRLRVRGTVQGVGFRPFVHRLATSLGLTGAIGNDHAGVWCEVQGPSDRLDEFVQAVSKDAPPLARVESVVVESIEVVDDDDEFVIRRSDVDGSAATISIPPDVAMCPGCRSDIDDVDDRRFRYAFTCCADCGPRYTVVQTLPYDRERTSMSEFPMCPACGEEYASPGDRRFHAQATCCPNCGPTLTLLDLDGRDVAGDPLETVAHRLGSGSIVAVKGVGGFQLLCRAADDAVVAELRGRKHRDEKPFALLVDSLDAARELIEADPITERALSGPEAPIVLAPRVAGAPVAASVAPGNELLGVMLPATPLHALLARAVPFSLVCTSGNRSEEPIAVDDDELDRLRDIADLVLTHDRRIERRADDSVGQVVLGQFQLLRRARGYAPRPVRLSSDGPTVLGVGAELKNTVCLAVGTEAHLSVHLGDLEHPLTVAVFEHAIADQITMARATPELVVHDLHPEYISTKFATTQDLAPTLGVQHHHAHLASCLAEHGVEGPAIGVMFDGLGWGDDGTIWGGEFLVGDVTGYERAGHVATVAMPGLAQAIREPWRMAVAHLVAAFDGDLPECGVLRRHQDRVDDVTALCSTSIRTSSMGRVFDAVAALCNLSDTVSYEGQAAIMLEQRAGEHASGYGWEIRDDGECLVADAAPVIRQVVSDIGQGVGVDLVAGAFHRGVAEMVADTCTRLHQRTGITTIALSGGVFQNRRLVELLVPRLDGLGLTTLRHAQVPPNDGGISLGQVAVGRARLAVG
ncbi:MAG: carbamoyltransferase HypF [Ilumatobacter sp.]|nr:carbamoyltransferase HypF [Ilumatobacter sp.]